MEFLYSLKSLSMTSSFNSLLKTVRPQDALVLRTAHRRTFHGSTALVRVNYMWAVFQEISLAVLVFCLLSFLFREVVGSLDPSIVFHRGENSVLGRLKRVSDIMVHFFNLLRAPAISA